MNINENMGINNLDVNKYIGSKIRYYRKLRDWTQTKLGDEVGVSFQQIQKYEKGVNSVSFPKLVQICNALEISLNDVLKDLINNKSGISKSFDGSGGSSGSGGGGSGGNDGFSKNDFHRESINLSGLGAVHTAEENSIKNKIASALNSKRSKSNLKVLFNVNCAIAAAVESLSMEHSLDFLRSVSTIA